MKICRKNSLGFAHHALLGVLVVAIIALAGIKVLTATHALDASSGCSSSTPAPTISPNEDQAFPNSQGYVTIDVSVPECKHALAVEWYRDGNWLGALATHTPATAANGYKNHFYFSWRISYATANSYHWTVKIHNRNGVFYPVNNQGDKYLDLLVIGNGYFHGSEFITPDNNAVWKACDQSNFLQVEVETDWNDLYEHEPSDPEGVIFQNTSVNNPIHYKVTQINSHKYFSKITDLPGDMHKKVYYRYYPVGADCLKKGPYDWIARVIGNGNDKGGQAGVRLAQEHGDNGVYHLNMTVGIN